MMRSGWAWVAAVEDGGPDPVPEPIPPVPMAAVQRIHDLVREGRMSPATGAYLLELRRELRWRRRPWYAKAWSFLGRMLGLWGYRSH